MTGDRDWRLVAPYVPPASGFSGRVRQGGPVWLYGTPDGTAWTPPADPTEPAPLTP